MEFKSSESERLSSDSSHSLVAFEIRIALDESSRGNGRGISDSGEFTSRGASSRAEDFLTYFAFVKGRRERTSEMTFGKIKLLVSFVEVETGDDCGFRSVEIMWPKALG